MDTESLKQMLQSALDTATASLSLPATYTQVGIIALIYAVAYVLSRQIRTHAPVLDDDRITDASHPILRFIANCGNLIFPLTAILLLRVSVELSNTLLDQDWLVRTALTIALLLLFISAVNDFVGSAMVRPGVQVDRYPAAAAASARPAG